MGGRQRYWAFDWLEENYITTLREAAALLPKYRVIDSLQRRAADAAAGNPEASPLSPASLVAGTGLDLSGGGMVCNSPKCLRRQVDNLLRHVWHYFDTVIAEDVLTPLLIDCSSTSKTELIETLLRQLSPLLYLKEIGATHLVDFRPKDHCAEHWQENAKVEGFESLLSARQDVILQLAEKVTIIKVDSGATPTYQVYFPETGVSTLISISGADEQQIKIAAASQAFEIYMVDLVADVTASHRYQLPLGSADPVIGRMLQLSKQSSEVDVMFNLQLPVLDGVPAAELITIRREHAQEFDRFRRALRLAAKERLRAGPDSNPKKIADEIRTELIEPELARIGATLKAAERTLAKKSSVSLYVGFLATTCSLLAGLPPSIALPAGVAATLTGVGQAATKDIETRSEVSLSDMYFLWKATEHAH